MKNVKRLVVSGVFSLGAVIAFLIFFFLFKKKFQPDDFSVMVKWWGTVLAIGVCFYPLSACLFRKFSDRGYAFSKVIGIAVGGWLMWLLSSLHILKFSTISCYITFALCFVVTYGVLFYLFRKKTKELPEFLGLSQKTNVIPKILWTEVLFFVVFAALVYLKCFNPKIDSGTEKYMDYGFMKSMMKSDYMPPEDLWFSGTNLNYYYLGQYFCVYLCRLSGIDVNPGYNLSLMMVGAFCFVLTYSLVSRIFETFLKEKLLESGKKLNHFYVLWGQTLFRIAGLLSALGVTLASSCQYLVYGKLVPIIREILGMEPGTSYYFPDATRYIGYQREGTGDKTIHEFPSYSFVLGDLHAHVIDIMFVLTLLAILFSWLLMRRSRMKETLLGKYQKINYKQEMLNPNIIFLSFFIGIFQMSNYWDFPIYFVVCGAVILVSNAIVCGFHKQTFALTAVHAAEFIIISAATAFMFTVRFVPMAGGIGLCKKHTELYQMIVVWAFPIVSVLIYLGTLIREEMNRKKTQLRTENEKENVFFTWLSHLKVSELFLIILGLCAIGLVMIPEVIYVVDIYSGDYQRANTMFKLTYQAFILFGIVLGALCVRYLLAAKNIRQFLGGVLILFLLVQNVSYFKNASDTWFGDIKNKENYKTLDVMEYLKRNYPEDYGAAAWIDENIPGRPVICEANGLSYTSYNHISVISGCTTVLGWHTHEWLWKNGPDPVNQRADDLFAIYNGTDRTEVMNLLRKYDVEYLYVGPNEAEKYEYKINYSFLRSLGEVVYDDSEAKYVETFLVKIK